MALISNNLLIIFYIFICILSYFKIVDEMIKKDIKVDASTYNFLLVSCIANKEAGFTYAVEVLNLNHVLFKYAFYNILVT